MRPFRVLFVCSDNASRSQMAEGWLRHLGGPSVVVRSAGTDARHLHPIATHAMQAAGVDISAHRGKGLDAVEHERFDLAVTLCDDVVQAASERVTARDVVHRHFDDPTWLEDPEGPDPGPFLELRDALRRLVEELLERMPG